VGFPQHNSGDAEFRLQYADIVNQSFDLGVVPSNQNVFDPVKAIIDLSKPFIHFRKSLINMPLKVGKCVAGKLRLFVEALFEILKPSIETIEPLFDTFESVLEACNNSLFHSLKILSQLVVHGTIVSQSETVQV